MKKLYCFISLFLCLGALSQSKFEKGYILTSQNTRIECLIKNRDWINAPGKIDYKQSENSEIETIESSQITTFQIYNSDQYYKKAMVLVDRNVTKRDFNPEQQQLWLKVLVEGKATLYSENSGMFFYQKENGEVKQLVYKEYENDKHQIEKSFLFRAELYNQLKCNENDAVKLRKVSYDKKDLADFFVAFNRCAKADYTDYTKKTTPLKVGFMVFTGLSFNNFKSNVPIAFADIDSKTQIMKVASNSFNLQLGVEIELLMPFHNNKWGIFIAPNYQNLKISASQVYKDGFVYYTMAPGPPSSGGDDMISIGDLIDISVENDFNYSFIEIPVGIRHYFNINQKSKLFLDTSFGWILDVGKPSEKAKVESLEANKPKLMVAPFNSRPSASVKVGAGYSFMGKYSVGLNYYPKRQLSNSSGSSFSVTASYKIF